MSFPLCMCKSKIYKQKVKHVMKTCPLKMFLLLRVDLFLRQNFKLNTVQGLRKYIFTDSDHFLNAYNIFSMNAYVKVSKTKGQTYHENIFLLLHM